MRSPHTATKSSPRLPQLEKARTQQRPNAAKNEINKINKNFQKILKWEQKDKDQLKNCKVSLKKSPPKQ